MGEITVPHHQRLRAFLRDLSLGGISVNFIRRALNPNARIVQLACVVYLRRDLTLA